MKFLNSRLFQILITVVSLIVVIGVSRSLYSLWQKRDIITERKEALAALEKKQRELRKKLEEVQSLSFIERAARESLGLIKEGEAIVLVPRTHPPDGGPEPKDQTKRNENIPNWKKWWKLFF